MTHIGWKEIGVVEAKYQAHCGAVSKIQLSPTVSPMNVNKPYSFFILPDDVLSLEFDVVEALSRW